MMAHTEWDLHFNYISKAFEKQQKQKHLFVILHLDFARAIHTVAAKPFFMSQLFNVTHRAGTDDDLFNVIQTLDSDGFVLAIASKSARGKTPLHCNCFLLFHFLISLTIFIHFTEWKKVILFPSAICFQSLERLIHCNECRIFYAIFFLFLYFFYYNYSAYFSPLHSIMLLSFSSWAEVKILEIT